MKRYVFNILAAIKCLLWALLQQLDFVLNALTGGDPQEYISSRAGKYAARRSGWFPCQLCKVLHWLDPNHCEKNIQPDEGSDGLIWSKDK